MAISLLGSSFRLLGMLEDGFLKEAGSVHTGAEDEGGCTLTTFTGGLELSAL